MKVPLLWDQLNRDPNVSSMGAFADKATRGGLLGNKVADFALIGGIMSALTGRSNMDRRRDNVRRTL